MENKLNKNFLHLAVEESNLTKIKNLAGKNKNLINQQDAFKNTPLHLAIKTGDIKIINELLKFDFDPDVKDEAGFDILDLAIKNKNTSVIGQIIGKYPPENKPELLFFAAKYYPEIINLLISRGFKTDFLNEKGENLLMEYLKYNDNFPNFPVIIDHFDGQRNTPLHIYLIYQNDINLGIIEKFEPYYYTIPNKSGMSPLDLLITEHSRYDLFEHLLKKYHNKGLKINERDNLGNTLLHRISNKGKEKLIELLIDLGADLNLQNVKGDTPLHILLKNQIPINYHKLMEHCPNLFIRNKLGKTPLFYARGQIKTKFDKTFIPHIDKILGECKLFQKNLNSVNKSKNNSGYTLFSGTGLNEIMGIAFLKKKYPELCFAIGSEKIYSGIGDTNRYVIDYAKYNIIWDGKELEFPKDFKKEFDFLLNSSCRFLIVPITLVPIIPEESLHANYLIIDKERKTAERFEPHGGLSQYFYRTDNLDDTIIKELNINYKYFKPIDFLPIVGFQTLQSYENFVYLLNRVGDPEGFCAAWGLYYLDLRFANPDLEPKELVQIGIEELLADSRELTDFIRDYSAYIIKERNGVLNKIIKKKNIIEEKLSSSQMKKIEKYIRNTFKSGS